MRILQIINSPDPGGVLALANDIRAGLTDGGHELETCFITARADMSKLAKLRGSLGAARRIVFGGYDAVIAYQAAPAIIVGVAGLLTRRPQRIVHQTTIPSVTAAPLRLLDRILGTLGLYPVNIVNTVSTRHEYSGYPAAYRKRLLLIEHGVAKPVLSRNRNETLQLYGITDDAKILLNTGRLVEQKNQETIIRAMPNLHGVHFMVAGEGDCQAAYRNLAEDLGVSDRVHLLGALPHDEVIQLYGAADLFVFPSRHETFGISAVEAVLLGLPTIVSDIPVLREVLHVDGASQVAFVAEEDVGAWERAIGKWLDQPPHQAQLEAFGRAIGQKYSRERMLKSYLELVHFENHRS